MVTGQAERSIEAEVSAIEHAAAAKSEIMKVGILAGGFGTRLAEETEIRPKPMVEIGGMPILWHIMKHYHTYGHREFAVALGHKGEYIKRWFHDYNDLDGTLTVNTATGQIKRHKRSLPDWSIDLVETGRFLGAQV